MQPAPFVETSELLERAFRLAVDAHTGAGRRKATNIEHPIEVARLLYGAHYPETVVAAGLLHDVVEDTTVGIEDIKRSFGDQVAGLVGSLTEDEAIEAYASRKARLRRSVIEGGSQAAAIFVADKLATLSKAVSDGVELRVETLDHYRKTVNAVEARYPDIGLLGELRKTLRTYEQGIAYASDANRGR